MNKGGKIKKGNGNNRGYIGYHTTWDNKKVFLRSKSEFVYARKLDYERVPYLLECKTYYVDSVRYKPDFFLYTDINYNKLISIVEVKGADDKKTALIYLDSYKEYFSGIGIKYDVVWKQRATIKKYSLTNEINDWIKTSVDNYDDVSDVGGENNPMYGLTQTDKTKKVISEKAKIRCSNHDYLKVMSDAQKEYWDGDEGLVRRKKLSEEKIKLGILRNPIIAHQCKECKEVFNKKLNSKSEFCSGKCKRSWFYKNNNEYGKHKKQTSYHNQLKTYINKILNHYSINFDHYLTNIETFTQQAKKDKLIPKNKGITLETIKKYKINL